MVATTSSSLEYQCYWLALECHRYTRHTRAISHRLSMYYVEGVINVLLSGNIHPPNHPQLQGKESRRRRNYEPRQDNNETMYYLLVIIFENFPRHFLLDLPTAAQHHERRYFSISTSSSPSTHSPSVYGVPEERIKVGLCNNINKIENNPSCCWEWQSGGTC